MAPGADGPTQAEEKPGYCWEGGCIERAFVSSPNRPVVCLDRPALSPPFPSSMECQMFPTSSRRHYFPRVHS